MELLKEYEEEPSDEEIKKQTKKNNEKVEEQEEKGDIYQKEEASKEQKLLEKYPTYQISCAPDVNTYDVELKNYKEKFHNIDKQIESVDPEFHQITSKPQQGPAKNWEYNFLKNAYKNHFNGSIQPTFINNSVFDYQYNKFNDIGIVENPSLRYCYKKEYSYIPHRRSYKNNILKQTAAEPNEIQTKKKRTKSYEYEFETYKGPFQIPQTEGNVITEPSNSVINKENPNEETNKEEIPKSKIKVKNDIMKLESCTLELSEEKNLIQGKNTLFDERIISTLHINPNLENEPLVRSWFDLPPEYKEKDFMIEENFPPKKEIHEYKGHKMGVQRIRFFPKYGNYLLSASLDSTLKLWGVYKSKQCIRTYKGHFKGVKDVVFDKEGTNFLSCSYDKNVIYWDTEYGKIKGIYNQKKTPYCLCLNHDDPNTFLVGGENNKICQYDFRTGNIELEYNEHLQAINTITLCENNKKLISTSDDKKIFIWEYGLPVVVKYISDASMFSITSVSLHPKNNFFLCQSMNNTITVYESTGKFRLFSKKMFRGHQNIGYSINVSCSNDGKYVISGDSNGRLFIWNWKKMSSHKIIKAHKDVCIDCVWHPFKTSLLATASWDSTIKLWE